MIEQIAVKNFKSFRDVNLKLGRLNIFIGSNASGKSNFFDALRVLQGIGYGFTLREILDGKPKSVSSEVWEGVRGGSTTTASAFGAPNQSMWFQVSGRLPEEDNCFEFTVAFAASHGMLQEESLSVSGGLIYDSPPGQNSVEEQRLSVRYYLGLNGQLPRSTTRVERDRPVLTALARHEDSQFPKEGGRMAERVARVLADMQRLDPSPAILRAYSQAYEAKRMGERGENFAALVRLICSDSRAKEAYLNWLRELRPRDVDDVGTLKGAIGEPMVMMKENGREWPAPVLSDGTLRFAAIAAAFFQPDMPGVLTIEEIENGVHASRLRLLVELLRNQAAEGKTQVMVTTHSPIVLAWLKPEEYATTFYCKRDEQTGESLIRPLTEIPRFNEIIRRQPISDLFAEGWMETAL
jgi:predicted ATPase